MFGQLPTSLIVGDREYSIDADYRNIINILLAFKDDSLSQSDKLLVLLNNFYNDIPYDQDNEEEILQEAVSKAMDFITIKNDKRLKQDDDKHYDVIDYEQDEDILFSAVNEVAHKEVRNEQFVHWWTFQGWMKSLSSESLYSTVISLRLKKAKGEKLEEYEKKFWERNKDICVIAQPSDKEAEEEKAEIMKMLGL